MRPAEAMGQAEPYGLMRGAQADFVVLEKRKVPLHSGDRQGRAFSLPRDC